MTEASRTGQWTAETVVAWLQLTISISDRIFKLWSLWLTANMVILGWYFTVLREPTSIEFFITIALEWVIAAMFWFAFKNNFAKHRIIVNEINSHLGSVQVTDEISKLLTKEAKLPADRPLVLSSILFGVAIATTIFILLP